MDNTNTKSLEISLMNDGIFTKSIVHKCRSGSKGKITEASWSFSFANLSMFLSRFFLVWVHISVMLYKSTAILSAFPEEEKTFYEKGSSSYKVKLPIDFQNLLTLHDVIVWVSTQSKTMAVNVNSDSDVCCKCTNNRIQKEKHNLVLLNCVSDMMTWVCFC